MLCEVKKDMIFEEEDEWEEGEDEEWEEEEW
ncbi:MAG: pyruvate dehydrogenase [Bacillota bacterium]